MLVPASHSPTGATSPMPPAPLQSHSPAPAAAAAATPNPADNGYPETIVKALVEVRMWAPELDGSLMERKSMDGRTLLSVRHVPSRPPCLWLDEAVLSDCKERQQIIRKKLIVDWKPNKRGIQFQLSPLVTTIPTRAQQDVIPADLLARINEVAGQLKPNGFKYYSHDRSDPIYQTHFPSRLIPMLTECKMTGPTVNETGVHLYSTFSSVGIDYWRDSEKASITIAMLGADQIMRDTTWYFKDRSLIETSEHTAPYDLSQAEAERIALAMIKPPAQEPAPPPAASNTCVCS